MDIFRPRKEEISESAWRGLFKQVIWHSGCGGFTAADEAETVKLESWNLKPDGDFEYFSSRTAVQIWNVLSQARKKVQYQICNFIDVTTYHLCRPFCTKDLNGWAFHQQ